MRKNTFFIPYYLLLISLQGYNDFIILTKIKANTSLRPLPLFSMLCRKKMKTNIFIYYKLFSEHELIKLFCQPSMAIFIRE